MEYSEKFCGAIFLPRKTYVQEQIDSDKDEDFKGTR